MRYLYYAEWGEKGPEEAGNRLRSWVGRKVQEGLQPGVSHSQGIQTAHAHVLSYKNRADCRVEECSTIRKCDPTNKGFKSNTSPH